MYMTSLHYVLRLMTHLKTGKLRGKSSSVPSTSSSYECQPPLNRLLGVLNSFNVLASEPTLISYRERRNCSLLKSHQEHHFNFIPSCLLVITLFCCLTSSLSAASSCQIFYHPVSHLSAYPGR